MPRFSVVIPLYNKEKDFPLTLKSLMAQTFSDFEAIIVNDGSTDKSAAIAEAENDARIKIFNKKNEGLAATRNYGVEKATAENVIFLDADDFWHPFHLENMDDILRKFPNAQWFATAYEKKHNEKLTQKMVSPLNGLGEDWIGEVNYFENSMADSAATGSSLGIKRSFFRDLGGHNVNVTFAEDTDLWIRAAIKEPLAFSNKISAIIMLDTSNRINHSNPKSRIYPNFDNYNYEASKNPFLKKYLDIHRFSIALGYKMAGDMENFRNYRNKIAVENLNEKQKLLMNAPRAVLIASKYFKQFLQKFGLYFSIYK